MRAAAHVVWETNDWECDFVAVVVVCVIRLYVECCEAMRDCEWFCVQRFGGLVAVWC